MQLDPNGNFVASPLLVEAPSLRNGGLSTNPFTVRFHISARAVWADGSPITSADFDFTWKAILNTTGAYTTVGYTSIDSIDTTDPKRAVIMFKDVFVDWPDLFGGVYQGLLEKTAFPTFAKDPEPNLWKEMQDTIPFSGGPLVLKSWSKERAVLARNDNYFGTIPLMDQIELVPTTDQPRELTSLLGGDVHAIYPQPYEYSLLEELRKPGVTAEGRGGDVMGALWLDQTKPPLNDRRVREALLYAIDRQMVVDAGPKLNDPRASVVNCGLVALPTLGPWCATQPFERYAYDPVKARALLEDAGYEGSATPCTKAGRPLSLPFSTDGASTLLTSSQDIIVKDARAAGIELQPRNLVVGRLFGGILGCPFQHLDSGPIQVCLRPISVDPTVTDFLACDRIPAPANRFAANNVIGWCNPEATRLMKSADRELDPVRRLELMRRVYELEAEDAIGLPLFTLPAVSAWRSDRIGGPIGVWNGTPYGLFFNMNEWDLAS